MVLIALAFLFFSICDMQAKLLTGAFHPIQVVWARQFGLFLGAFVLLVINGKSLLRTRNPFLQIVRGALVVVSATCFIFAVRFVPLADVVAVTFIAPFVVTALSGPVLGEQVGPRRWGAVAVGFVGAMIVIRPGLGVMHPAVLLVVVAATGFAIRQVLSRRLAASDKTITTVAYTAIVSFVLLSLPLYRFWDAPDTASQWALLAGMTVTAALGELLVIRAMELGEAAILAPVQYSLMVWATFWGWLIFSDLPDGWTLLGASIIIATGLYIIRCERR